jgi:hypothetical protein
MQISKCTHPSEKMSSEAASKQSKRILPVSGFRLLQANLFCGFKAATAVLGSGHEVSCPVMRI